MLSVLLGKREAAYGADVDNELIAENPGSCCRLLVAMANPILYLSVSLVMASMVSFSMNLSNSSR